MAVSKRKRGLSEERVIDNLINELNSGLLGNGTGGSNTYKNGYVSGAVEEFSSNPISGTLEWYLRYLNLDINTYTATLVSNNVVGAAITSVLMQPNNNNYPDPEITVLNHNIPTDFTLSINVEGTVSRGVFPDVDSDGKSEPRFSSISLSIPTPLSAGTYFITFECNNSIFMIPITITDFVEIGGGGGGEGG